METNGIRNSPSQFESGLTLSAYALEPASGRRNCLADGSNCLSSLW